MLEPGTGEATPWLIFNLAGQRYGLPVSQVVRIIEMVAMLDLPGAPEGVQGMINLQGQIIPVIDLRRRWGLPAQAYTLRTPIILVQVEGEAQPMGLIVDKVEEVIEVAIEQIKRIEQVTPRESAAAVSQRFPYLAGVARWGQQLGLLVRAETLLDPAERTRLEAALKQSVGE